MARRFPVLNPEQIKDQGECTVARALIDHLSNRVEVFHGFNWLSRSGAGTIMEDECDFVLLDAERGLLFDGQVPLTLRYIWGELPQPP